MAMALKTTTYATLMALLLIGLNLADAFITHTAKRNRRNEISRITMALGDFSVQLSKPLGIILEEQEDVGQGGGVKIESIAKGSNADTNGVVAPGDVLLKIGDQDVANSDFDLVMNMLMEADSPIDLTLGDGLGRMDIAANLAKRLKPEEALFADAVVRASVREIRRNGRLGSLERVEIVIGAGCGKEDAGIERCLVRFFAIFSTDGVSTYSCNVSAKGIRDEGKDNTQIKIVALSCAKDEGLGQTIDLIVER